VAVDAEDFADVADLVGETNLETMEAVARVLDHLGDEGALTNKTYRADSIKFDNDEKRQLQALQRMDVGFSEVFFGSYPILVEGDTEHAAFLAAAVEPEHKLSDDVTIIRARGKAILPALIRMLHHFKVDFSVVHDIDWPYSRKTGNAAAMWTINESIYGEIKAARDSGLRVRHRCSIPDFERYLGYEELGKEKPLEAHLKITKDEALKEKVRALFQDLRAGNEDQPFGFNPNAGTAFNEFLKERLQDWAGQHGEADDPRLTGENAEDA